jgi:hypothetical protein
MIHGFPNLGNATEVSEGIYYGGSDEAMDLMSKGQANPGEFRFFFKYTAWLPGKNFADRVFRKTMENTRVFCGRHM